jgi:hypothetical protein
MRFAYADPPYLGMAKRYPEHPEAHIWDDPETHRQLISRLCADYPDGWALSASSPSLRTIMPMCPDDVRIGAWVKPFAVFKANVRIAYAWEPVIFCGGRKSSKDGAPVGRDWFSHVITLKRGTIGTKPPKFCRWVLDLLGYVDGDTVDDLFPGSGAMGHVAAQGLLAVT